MKEVGMKLAISKSGSVDDIVAAVEDAVRRAYALGRSDAMKRVVELAQADDPGLRTIALLGPAEPSRQAAPGLEVPAEPAPVMDEVPPDAAPAQHAAPDEAHQATLQAEPPASQPPAPQPPAPQPHDPSGGSPQDPPRSVGNFLADYFYPLGSKK